MCNSVNPAGLIIEYKKLTKVKLLLLSKQHFVCFVICRIRQLCTEKSGGRYQKMLRRVNSMCDHSRL